MNNYIVQQLELFRNLLKRNLTPDEEYLVKNAFLNGYEQGQVDLGERLRESLNYI